MAALPVCAPAVKLATPSLLMRSSSNLPSARAVSVLPRVARKRCGVARAAGAADENMCPDSLPANFSCVDAHMVTLRRRIESMRLKESFMHTPEEWMEWERSCYNTYRADVNVLLATLQSTLLSMRPSVVLSVVSILFAIAPVAALLFFSALGNQLYWMNNAVLDMLSSA